MAKKTNQDEMDMTEEEKAELESFQYFDMSEEDDIAPEKELSGGLFNGFDRIIKTEQADLVLVEGDKETELPQPVKVQVLWSCPVNRIVAGALTHDKPYDKDWSDEDKKVIVNHYQRQKETRISGFFGAIDMPWEKLSKMIYRRNYMWLYSPAWKRNDGNPLDGVIPATFGSTAYKTLNDLADHAERRLMKRSAILCELTLKKEKREQDGKIYYRPVLTPIGSAVKSTDDWRDNIKPIVREISTTVDENIAQINSDAAEYIALNGKSLSLDHAPAQQEALPAPIPDEVPL